MIDEIDNFSHNAAFKHFLNQVTQLSKCVVLGIANSVDLFKGEVVAHKKVIFEPYNKEQLSVILLSLFKDFLFAHPLNLDYHQLLL